MEQQTDNTTQRQATTLSYILIVISIVAVVSYIVKHRKKIL